MARVSSREATGFQQPAATPEQWRYAWTLAHLPMETLLSALGAGRIYIGHAPGGSLDEIVSTNFAPTARAKTVTRWRAYTVSALDAKNPVLLASGMVEIGPVYDIAVLWRPEGPVATLGYMQPIYLDLQMIEGVRTNLGTMTLTIRMGGTR